ncbi:hypothetical protein Enr17x_04110 [Gimesia fumaroli]|uniref:Uncharacterized protein n=2 Tax=Gimesia TaxID=1649453 RepID=A0A517VEQ3_9PLAN|nr:hypothetical protein Pan161_31410 [Gimesia algae]QDV48399.1 hypothetical protein Enr17x_04110 [Gimesia fumaroli]
MSIECLNCHLIDKGKSTTRQKQQAVKRLLL